jgi:hypothetical protein
VSERQTARSLPRSGASTAPSFRRQRPFGSAHELVLPGSTCANSRLDSTLRPYGLERGSSVSRRTCGRVARVRYLAEILASIVSSGRADDLAVTTSMPDLVITPRPVPEPPLDVVIVRAPNSLRNGPRPGHVVIEEMSLTGHGDLIERPAAEAVPLFWRFMIEKYGVHPSR